MAARSFVVVALLAAAPALAACSGATDQDVLGPSAGSDTSPTEPSAPPTSPGASTPSVPSAPAPDDPAAPGPKDPADPPAQPAAPACTPEIEPDNDLAHATPFDKSVCGKISSGADVDYVSFVAPKDADVVRVQHTETGGHALYRYYLEGAPVGIQGGELEALPGATYTIQVRLDKNNSAGSLPSYEIDVTFH